jgi:hypothetical protein
VAGEQKCYAKVAAIEKCKAGRTPLKLPADYLSRTGYRLPSEARPRSAYRATYLPATRLNGVSLRVARTCR